MIFITRLSFKYNMVTLTRLNGKSFIINALYIEQIESFPDTTITLTNGKKFVVRESEGDVMLSVVNFYRSIQILGLHKHLEEDRFEE